MKKVKLYGLEVAVFGGTGTKKYYFATQEERNDEYSKIDHVSKFAITVSEEESEELITDTKASISLKKEEQKQIEFLKEKFK